MERIVDLFDQAILYLHLGYTQAFIKERRKFLRKFGIRSATELARVLDSDPTFLSTLKAYIRNPSHSKEFASVDEAFVARLPFIKLAFEQDAWFRDIQKWRSRAYIPLYYLHDFYPKASACRSGWELEQSVRLRTVIKSL
jgi:hypothetical protein